MNDLLDHSFATDTRHGRRTTLAVLGGAGCVLALSAATHGVTRLGGEPAQVPGSSSIVAGAPTSTPTAGPDTSPGVPVHLVLDGWTCEEYPADDKSWCTGPDGVNASINWRPASEHADWTGGDPDKTALAVSDVHGQWFATITLTENHLQLAHELGEALVWGMRGVSPQLPAGRQSPGTRPQ